MNLHDARAFCLPDGYEVTQSPSYTVAVKAVFLCLRFVLLGSWHDASLTPLASCSPLSLAGGGLFVGRREAFVAPVLRPHRDRRPRPQHHVGQVNPTYPPTHLPTYIFLLTTCAPCVCDVAETSTATTTCQVATIVHRAPLKPLSSPLIVCDRRTVPSQPPQRCCRVRGAEQPEAHGLRQRGVARPRARGAHPRLLPPGTPYLGPYLAPI